MRRSRRGLLCAWIAALSLLIFANRALMGAAGDTTADRVLGQFDFTHNGANILTNAGLSEPGAVAIDRSVVPNRLYVADAGNHRVLGWHNARWRLCRISQ